MPEENTDDQPSVEVAECVRRRRSEALEAGFTKVEANLFAESEISVSELRHLVELDCPRELRARIVL